MALPLAGAALAWAVAFTALGAWKGAAAAFVLLPLAGICQAGLALGSLLVPLLVSLGGVSAALIGVAAVLAVAAIASIAALRGLDTAMTDTGAIDILRGHPLFAALTAAVLEGLARELTPISVRAGEAVITEGEVGDRFT